MSRSATSSRGSSFHKPSWTARESRSSACWRWPGGRWGRATSASRSSTTQQGSTRKSAEIDCLVAAFRAGACGRLLAACGAALGDGNFDRLADLGRGAETRTGRLLHVDALADDLLYRLWLGDRSRLLGRGGLSQS